MFAIRVLLLPSFILGVLSVSPLVDFQEQFSELSRSIEPQLRDYRAQNWDIRANVFHRALEALGVLTIEMRNITWDYWARIESHELANPECLERIRVEFDNSVLYGEQDIQTLAATLHNYLTSDVAHRFYPVVSQAQRENSRTIYQTVQTLGRNQFLDNWEDMVLELQFELNHYQNTWEWNQGRLQLEFDNAKYLVEGVEDSIAFWHELSVRWHRLYMGYQLESVKYMCAPNNVKNTTGSPMKTVETGGLRKINRRIPLL